MKKLTITLFLMALFSNNSKAQNIPSNAEDICSILIGETLPNVILQDANGNNIELKDILKRKPSVG